MAPPRPHGRTAPGLASLALLALLALRTGPAAWVPGSLSAGRPHSTAMQAAEGESAAAQQEVMMVTGATDGIGRWTAEQLAKRKGTTVIVHGRNADKVQKTLQEIEKNTGNTHLHGVVADLSLMEDVRRMASEVKEAFPRIHGLLNNAGTFDGDYSGKRVVTAEGNEYSLAVNVMAPFLLTSLLLDNVKASGAGRVIITSSMSAGCHSGLQDLQLEKHYSAHDAYSLSKLCDAMVTMEMHDRYGDPPNLCFHTLDPDPTSSWIDTKMLRAGWSSGGHPVSRATASFQMLTEAKFGRQSGVAWGCTKGGSKQQQERLWTDLVGLTGASWPQ